MVNECWDLLTLVLTCFPDKLSMPRSMPQCIVAIKHALTYVHPGIPSHLNPGILGILWTITQFGSSC